MDQTFPGSNIRIFNPGFVFIIFGSILSLLKSRELLQENLQNTFIRARRTLGVFFCMTFLVQQLRANGSLDLLTENMPNFLLTEGAPLFGWLASMLTGTATMTNLLLSKVLTPHYYVPLTIGTALGIQLSFQSIVAMKSMLNDQISEKKIYSQILPISAFFLVVTAFIHYLIPSQ